MRLSVTIKPCGSEIELRVEQVWEKQYLIFGELNLYYCHHNKRHED